MHVDLVSKICLQNPTNAVKYWNRIIKILINYERVKLKIEKLYIFYPLTTIFQTKFKLNDIKI